MKNETVSMSRTFFFFFNLSKQTNPENQTNKQKPTKTQNQKKYQYLAPKVTLQAPAVKKIKKEKYHYLVRSQDVTPNDTSRPTPSPPRQKRI